jgi:hypothetical protein
MFDQQADYQGVLCQQQAQQGQQRLCPLRL